MRLVRYDGRRWNKVVQPSAAGISSAATAVPLPSSAASMLDSSTSLPTAQQPLTDPAVTLPMEGMHSNLEEHKVGMEHLLNHETAPFCCDKVICYRTSNRLAHDSNALITDLVNVMKHNPLALSTPDSFNHPSISVRAVTSAFNTLDQYNTIFLIEKADHSTGRTLDRFFIPTWNTTSSYLGAYLEIELKNGDWASNSILRAALEPYYNNKRSGFKLYTCPVHPRSMYWCMVWEVTQDALPGVWWWGEDGNYAVFPKGYNLPAGFGREELAMACKYGLTIENWRAWREMNER